MRFEIVSEISHTELIAAGSGIRDVARLRKSHGEGRWRKLKGVATVRLPSGRMRLAEIHWYEAHGIGKRDFKVSLPGLTMAESTHFAVCVRNAGNEASLELRKLYEVIPDPDAEIDGMTRVIDESGEDYLFPSAFFVLIPLPLAVEQAVLEAMPDTSPVG